MQVVRWLFAVTVLALCTRGAAAQARPQGAARSMRDTLPERVVQRTIDAFTRRDLDATFANFDSVFTHEMLGDPTGAQRLRRDDYVRQMKADTAVMRRIKTQRIVVLHTDVFGAFVSQVWTIRLPDGREFKHFELIEVRGGKIVREIES
jgi:hypothetical protein